MNRIYLLVLLCFIYVQTLAQRKCGSSEYYNQQMANDPEFVKNQELLEQATKEFLKMGTLKSASVGPIYTIPVVVHVLWNQLYQNISDAQIQSQIDVLNKDFQLKNTDADNCPDYFKPFQADCQIAFCLAKRDPSGTCSNGIVRKQTPNSYFSINGIIGGFSADNAKFTSQGGDDAWDPSSYLNIWVVPQIKDISGNEYKGYAQFPGDLAATDGVVFCQSDFGTIGNAYNISKGRTATHEIGHWLNLKHIWGNTPLIDNCYDGDGVDDTPNQLKSHDGECPQGIQKSCSDEPFGDMYMNYMDYTEDECMNLFTKGQKNRMLAALSSNTRKTIFRDGNLALVSPLADLMVINQQISSTIVESSSGITVSFAEDNSGSLAAPSNYVNFHLSIDNKLTPGLNGDIYLDQYFIVQSVTGLSQTIELSKQITIPSDVAPGEYYLFFAADGTGLVDECVKDNNFASVKITVTGTTKLNPPRNLTASIGNEQVTLTWLAPSSGIPISYNIYRSNSENGTYSLISSNIKTTNKIVSGLSNGTTYWFYVQAVYAKGVSISSSKAFSTPKISNAPSNDECSSATLLTSSNLCNYLDNQTVNNATASGKPKGTCDAYTVTPALADVWYYFKAQSTAQTITVDPNGSQLDALIVAYNSYTSNTEINCSDTPGGPGTISTLNLSGLVIGNFYYIRVYDYGMQTTMGNFRICVSGESNSNSCAINSVTPSSATHGPSRFSTTPGSDDVYFNAQPYCSFEVTNYCTWLTVSPMSGNTNNNGQAFLNYSIDTNTSTISRQCTFYINNKPVIITQNGEDATDDDKDGVINSLDLCPNTPIGEVIDANGCSSSQVISEIKSLQYNDVVLNTPQNRIISFTNEGTNDFTITNISITGTNANQFSIAPIPPIVVSTGSYQDLTVTFKPTSVGAKSAKIEITTNAVKIPTKIITLNGNGVDHLTKVLVSNPTTSYNFGDTKNAETSSKTFVIQNTGSNMLTISNLAIEGLNPEPYSITYAKTVPFDIGPGLTELVTVKFSPASLGSKSATLAITNNSDNLSPKYSIELLGNGTGNYYIVSINNLIALEYWFDDQYQAKISTPATSMFDSDLGAQIPTTGLIAGLHTIHIRYQDVNGRWSSVVSEFFYKRPVSTTGLLKITASEYWFDDAYEAKITTPITPGQTVTVNSGFEVGSLSNGLHAYHVRYKDDAGQWSSVVSEFFNKIPVAAIGSRKITASEYWFDDAYAAKVTTPITPGQTITIDSGLEVGSLSNGLHTFHVRYKDGASQWSSVVSEFFNKIPFIAGSRNITTSEYWFDDAYEAKITTPITPGQVVTINGGFEVGSLSNGLHTYHVRYKDDAGQWSSVVSEFFHKQPATAAQGNLITTYRYWFDGNHQAMISVDIPSVVNPYLLIKNINTCDLTLGDHTIHFQFRDSRHQWSSAVSSVITKSAAQKPVITANGPTTFCEGTNFTLTSSEEGTYLWSNGATTQSISVTKSGKYAVFANSEISCGLKSDTIEVLVNPLPNTVQTIIGVATVYQKQDNVTYLISAIAEATSYIWTLPSGATGTSSTNSITVGFGSNAISGDIKVKGHNGCGDGPESLLAIKVIPVISQDIPVITGWNIISANVVPSNLNMKNIFQPLIDTGKLKKVVDEAGKTVEDFGILGGWNNSIGNLNQAKGYKVNVTEPVTLSLEGAAVSLPLDISLTTGWNIISYPCATTQDAKAAVQPLIEAGTLRKIMDESGHSIEDFGVLGGWRNNIGNFAPGKGYKVYVTAPCTLTVASSGNKSTTILPDELPSFHFKRVFEGNGIDHMNIYLMNLESSGLIAGDEIGIFDGKYCVGSATLGVDQLLAGSISIPASSLEDNAKSVNGFTTGHTVELQVYRVKKSYKLDKVVLQGTDSFEKNGSLFVKVSAANLPTVQAASELDQLTCYPNPFSDQLTIEIQLNEPKKLEVNIYDMSGRLIRNLFKGKAGITESLVWDGRNGNGNHLFSGTYLVKANNMIEKIVLKK